MPQGKDGQQQLTITHMLWLMTIVCVMCVFLWPKQEEKPTVSSVLTRAAQIEYVEGAEIRLKYKNHPVGRSRQVMKIGNLGDWSDYGY
jgi:hypothetical protein